MSADTSETLLSAARRVVREFNIVMQHGGLVSESMEHAMNTLDIQVQREAGRQKQLELRKDHSNGKSI